MENLIVKITQLYEKHKKAPKTIEKLKYYVEKQLPDKVMLAYDGLKVDI